jgi:hypothetical protein
MLGRAATIVSKQAVAKTNKSGGTDFPARRSKRKSETVQPSLLLFRLLGFFLLIHAFGHLLCPPSL